MPDRSKVTLATLIAKMESGTPITMITCYDYPMAYLVDQAGVDMVLVGDSLGMTVLGYDSTLPVTQDVMIPHVQAVRRGSPNSWLIGDMPYMTYQPSVETAIRCAGRYLAETGCDAVKLEGGAEMADRIDALVKCGIPTMGHLGLTPQSAGALGGFKLQGKSAAQAKKILDDAKALEDAGCFSILLELVPDRVCELITDRASIPIISLGSGPRAHGQLLIFHDMFALYPKFKPRMAKVFADAGQVIADGLKRYVEEVATQQFPEREHWFGMKDEEFGELQKLLAE
ncbi:MAG: 3-methyl-2-oxobutanoate hydroxymethyltransferase [Armatimonadetes bacterium CG_4_10_14_3_um_filter_66_18]|nr:3-methyl-2-oxobutanoate hydroxymethyltransferase [Armatimonadota bacterium]PIU91273.1 MAG: 3-methyl-2-oxobutanoate hydroxymethyltransferase [Armatimonadetes bacterium CG06_land_8_20_14_3_00_66_21]PIY39196.1 MAG: 3-methyl-2-oxobutanoate hydroxymethyltransferase [Armatimonadetes bacterium CG_4_10_14_3_um_filter_66_18]NCO95558.1 3-methyl-2-oxobutanoate hydroxymethyltransferase [Armatimonadota bacterium]NCQ29505.1 3-methyl-2-oxobutanoate hydroxymethyltransferase [Armatimonadota bacterium]